MKFQKFLILNAKTANGSASEVEVLFNVDHIVSIEPIRISSPDKLLNVECD